MKLDHQILSKLAQEHGDAYYILQVDRFRSNLRDLRGAFSRIYPRTSIGYSYKTNYVPLLCKVANEEGCYAEVVSRMEYDLARRLGVPAGRILFNGPLKAAEDLEEALLSGAIVNVDSLNEIAAVEALSRRRPDVRLRVGVRCNFALEATHDSRFGIASDDDVLGTALARLRAVPGCELHGLHCHFSAYRGLAAFEERAVRMVELARTHFPHGAPAAIDLGGGFFGRMPEELRGQFGVEVPSYEDYAGAIATVFAEAFHGNVAPELILEPGAAVVADAVDFVCRVATLKRLTKRQVAVTTGSIQNIKATANPVRLPLSVVSDPNDPGVSLDGPVDITGYTCMESDVLYPGYPGELRIGDFLIFGNVGAYTHVFKPPFIRTAPAMLALANGGPDFDVARRRETLDDLLATYAV
jgi:diaminopimelate decarboxylase